jgi:hypothetical protein
VPDPSNGASERACVLCGATSDLKPFVDQKGRVLSYLCQDVERCTERQDARNPMCEGTVKASGLPCGRRGRREVAGKLFCAQHAQIIGRRGIRGAL